MFFAAKFLAREFRAKKLELIRIIFRRLKLDVEKKGEENKQCSSDGGVGGF